MTKQFVLEFGQRRCGEEIAFLNQRAVRGDLNHALVVDQKGLERETPFIGSQDVLEAVHLHAHAQDAQQLAVVVVDAAVDEDRKRIVVRLIHIHVQTVEAAAVHKAIVPCVAGVARGDGFAGFAFIMKIGPAGLGNNKDGIVFEFFLQSRQIIL